MNSDLPTGSITGQQGWEWNRWQAEKRSRSVPLESPTQQSYEYSKSDHRRRYPKHDDVRTLRVRLARKERRLQYVIDHYERLLTEKNRQLAKQETTKPAGDSLSAAMSNVLRRIADF